MRNPAYPTVHSGLRMPTGNIAVRCEQLLPA
mgnify:CR=1 FL=1